MQKRRKETGNKNNIKKNGARIYTICERIFYYYYFMDIW